jgi:UDPglucose--hexose-1-phosphate uridylyltransferase
VLIAGEQFTVFVPFAARWPVEVHMLPHRHVPDLAATTAAAADKLKYRAGSETGMGAFIGDIAPEAAAARNAAGRPPPPVAGLRP